MIGTRLVRIGIDGGSRETVRMIDDEPLYFRIHRGRCYYVTQWFEEDGTSHKEVRGFPLSKPSEDKLILEIPEDMDAGVLVYFLKPYGNYLYIDTVGASEKRKSQIFRMYRYDPANEKLEEFVLPGQEADQEIMGLQPFNQKLHGFLADKDSKILSGLYEMEMDGGSPREVMELPANQLYTDGKYLYVSNISTLTYDSEKEDKTATVWVYDKDYQLVDTFSEALYNNYCYDFAMGVGNFGYRMLRDEEDRCYSRLEIFDKSQIGTLDGKLPEFQVSVEMTASPADESFIKFTENGYDTRIYDGSFFRK